MSFFVCGRLEGLQVWQRFTPPFRDAWLGVLGLRELRPEECEVRLNKNRHLERAGDNVANVAF